MNGSEVHLREGTADDLPRIRSLWDALYEHQQAHGLLSELTVDGFERWAATLTAILGRFACLFVAEVMAEPVGFLAGRVRVPTAPFVPTPVGFVSEVFVATGRRGTGTGRRLIEAAEGWFVAQGVVRLELQVLSGNTAAQDAYKRLGWQDELVQMVYRLSPKG